METSTATWPAGRILALIGLILYIATGVFPYAASGLVAPLWGIAVLYFGWGIGFFSTDPSLPTPLGVGVGDACRRPRLLVDRACPSVKLPSTGRPSYADRVRGVSR